MSDPEAGSLSIKGRPIGERENRNRRIMVMKDTIFDASGEFTSFMKVYRLH